jgi:acyl carrier protein
MVAKSSQGETTMNTPDLQTVISDLIEIIRKHTQNAGESWNGATKVQDAGLDSFDVVELVFQVEDKYGIVVSLNANTSLTSDTTIQELGSLIVGQIDNGPGALK